MRVFVTGGSGFVGRNLVSDLTRRGADVRALARSKRAERIVSEAGGTPVSGDLSDVAALRQGMASCDVVIHAAAYVDEWGTRQTYYDVNVRGTENVLEAAASAHVRRLVHVSTEAVLVGGPTIAYANETWPYPQRPAGEYPRTKGIAESRVIAANTPGFTTVVVRPRFIWGDGDTSVLPKLVKAVTDGRFMWINGGHYRTSTTHVENVLEGIRCATDHGRGGEIYFVTDGEPVEFRAFVTELIRTQGLEPGDKSIPGWLARTVGRVSETAWRVFRMRGAPPVTLFGVRVIGEEVTIDDAKARRDIGYVGGKTREEGFAEMRAAGSGRNA